MDLDILQDYLVEARELLEKAQTDTLRLEAEPGNDEALASVFRAFHTVKGGAGFLEATHLVNWAHHLETLLDKLRSHSVPVTSGRIDAILKGRDVIEDMLHELAQGHPPSPGPEDLGSVIKKLAENELADAPASAGTPSSQAIATGITAGPCSGTPPETQALVEPVPVPDDLSVGASRSQQFAPPGAVAPTANVPKLEPGVSPGPLPIVHLATPPNSPETRTGQPAAAPSASPRGAEGIDSSLRVDALRLDAVMNQVGELVLLRNRLASAVVDMGKANEDLARIAREMDLTVNDLQNTVMRLRMQPCKRLFQQLPRVVRDVSRQLGKEVHLEIVGEDVEIDKTVVDALVGPMTHLIRNSLDHGIEVPEARVAANKPRTALIRCAAFHLGDKVRVEVSDDGKGIDRRFVTQRAIEKRVITQEQAAHLSEQEAMELIFRPGFSTKEQASDLSGRGVGMDVVKQTTQKLRGRLTVDSRPGFGTTVAMEFPLTLAVLPVLYLRVRDQTYALPISSIDSLTDLEEHRVHRVGGRVTYRVEGTQTVPLVDLGAALQNKPFRLGNERTEGVLTERGLFVVSEVLGNEDCVVKPIDFLSGQNFCQGATISGKGNVVLILDASALSAAACTAAERMDLWTRSA